jgi:lycopene cyclase CruA
LGNARLSADDNIICIGDAAALSSPLSYCGFGSFVRNLPRTTKALHHALKTKQLTKNSLKNINAFESRVAIMSNFAAFLQGKKGQPANTVNETMNLFMDVLAHLPNHVAQEVFRDTMKWESYNLMMSTVPKRHPMSYKILIRTHGFWGLLRWALNFVGFTLSEKGRKS